ncbi:monothiol glutaredoxin grx4 [Trapelia coarctata]|nr:monothiol glutaredoxin grx4 [Trapelia coarctata]
MSQITEITSPSDFSAHTDSLPPTTLLAISFYTPWATPCKQMADILSALASQYPLRDPPTVSFVSINAEDQPDISESYNVTAVPFLVLQRSGNVLESVSGCDAAKVRGAIENSIRKSGHGAGRSTILEALSTTPRAEAGEADTVNGSVSGTGANGSGATKDLSGYAPSASDPPTAPAMSSTADSTEALNARLAVLVKAAPVMLFMKGTPSSPQCGFSRQLVGLLRQKGVRYGFFNILADEEVRQGLKVWADWPTFPQLWVGGELVGGLDIVKEELENNPEFFEEYAVEPGIGGMAAPEAQGRPEVAST